MDLHTAITLVATDPAYDRGTTNGAVRSMRQTWSPAEVATFEPDELRTGYEIVLRASDAEIEEALTPQRRWNTPSPDGTPLEARRERFHRLYAAFKATYGDKEPVEVSDPRVAYIRDPREAEPAAGVVFARVRCEWHHRTGAGWCPCVNPEATGARWALTAAEHEDVLVEHLTTIIQSTGRHLDIPWTTVVQMMWRDDAEAAGRRLPGAAPGAGEPVTGGQSPFPPPDVA